MKNIRVTSGSTFVVDLPSSTLSRRTSFCHFKVLHYNYYIRMQQQL